MTYSHLYLRRARHGAFGWPRERGECFVEYDGERTFYRAVPAGERRAFKAWLAVAMGEVRRDGQPPAIMGAYPEYRAWR